eukprot:971201-Amphidinium_carterae.1
MYLHLMMRRAYLTLFTVAAPRLIPTSLVLVGLVRRWKQHRFHPYVWRELKHTTVQARHLTVERKVSFMFTPCMFEKPAGKMLVELVAVHNTVPSCITESSNALYRDGQVDCVMPCAVTGEAFWRLHALG